MPCVSRTQGEWASDGMLMVPAAAWWQPPMLSFKIGKNIESNLSSASLVESNYS